MDMGKPSAPTPPAAASPQSGEFSSGLMDCCQGDGACSICLVSLLLPCWAHGILGDAIADGAGRFPPCCCYCCMGFIPYRLGQLLLDLNIRQRTREKYGIPGKRFPDCCTVCWCGPCALSQEIRHIRDSMPGETLSVFANPPPKREGSCWARATAPYFS